jgi:hypothetical protein
VRAHAHAHRLVAKASAKRRYLEHNFDIFFFFPFEDFGFWRLRLQVVIYAQLSKPSKSMVRLEVTPPVKSSSRKRPGEWAMPHDHPVPSGLGQG